MMPLSKIAFVIEEFVVASPAQQLLDRFLLGYPYDGAFQEPIARTVAVAAMSSSEALRSRVDKHGLRVSPLEEALAGADGVIVVPTMSVTTTHASRVGRQWATQSVAPADATVSNDDLVAKTLNLAPSGSALFVYGALASTSARAGQFLASARQRSISILAGTSLAVAAPLPEQAFRPGTKINEALIVVPESSPQAEVNGLEGLLPLVERRRGGEAGVQRLDYFHGRDVWRLLNNDRKRLLAAAISRSHSPLGDPVRDGRTQDLVGLGLLPQLAPRPQVWRLEHRDGLQSLIVSLSGAVGDINVALLQAGGRIDSAQLFRPPPPAQHNFSRLAAALTPFFQSRQFPWPVERSLLQAALLETCRALPERSVRALKDPAWHIAYGFP